MASSASAEVATTLRGTRRAEGLAARRRPLNTPPSKATAAQPHRDSRSECQPPLPPLRRLAPRRTRRHEITPPPAEGVARRAVCFLVGGRPRRPASPRVTLPPPHGGGALRVEQAATGGGAQPPPSKPAHVVAPPPQRVARAQQRRPEAVEAEGGEGATHVEEGARRHRARRPRSELEIAARARPPPPDEDTQPVLLPRREGAPRQPARRRI